VEDTNQGRGFGKKPQGKQLGAKGIWSTHFNPAFCTPRAPAAVSAWRNAPAERDGVCVASRREAPAQRAIAQGARWKR